MRPATYSHALMGQTTRHAYDALNRIATSIYADGSTVTYSYDTCKHGIGRLCSLSDVSGTTSWEYDGQGNVVSKRQIVEGLTFETAYEYDAAGRLVSMTYPSGLVVGFEYHQGRPTALLINSQPFVTTVTYTPFGTVSGWNWSDGDPAYRTFDLDGRLVAQGLGTAERTLGYDPLGNIVAIHDPVTQLALTYDPLNRLSSATEASYRQSWTYDPNGNRLTQDENGQLTAYGIEVTSNRMVLAGPVSYQYDANGNRVDDGTHTYAFDASNRLIAVDDGNTARYRYNALGQRAQKTALAEGGGPDYLALALEAEQRAQQHREQADVLSEQAQASHEAADPLLAQATAARSEAVRLDDEAQALRERAAHDAGRAETFTSLAERLRQEAADLRARIVPNPNLLQRLLNAVYAGLAELAEALADSAQTRAVPYQQSAAAALAQAADKQQQTLALQAEADAMEQQAQVALNDADTLNDQAQEELQLAQAAEAEAADYRRLAEEGGSPGAPSTTWFVYDEEGRLIGEYDGSGNARQETVWLDGLPVATVQNGQPYAIHSDHLGTPRVITDSQGREVWRWNSDPFGTASANEDPDGDGQPFAFNLRFPGQYFDAETGLHQNYFRDYDPSTGRYTTSDPIGLNGGMNTYAYVGANPLRYTDVFGLEMDCKWVVIKYYDKVTPVLVRPELGYWNEVCFPVPVPSMGIPDPTSPRKRPGFPSPLDISFQKKCVRERVITHEAKWDTEVERWMQGYMQCTDTCTGEVKNHWSPDRRADDPPKI